MLSFWKVMLKSPTFWPFFSTNLSQKHKINFLSSMKLVTVPQKLFPNPKSNFTIREFFLQWLELVWQRYNCFSIFPIFHFSSRLPICIRSYLFIHIFPGSILHLLELFPFKFVKRLYQCWILLSYDRFEGTLWHIKKKIWNGIE